MEQRTKVVFRKFKGKNGGDVIALFPQEPGTNNVDTCLCYQHVGQHGSMDLRHRHILVTAIPGEYGFLKAELETLGYKLDVALNITPKDRKIRLSKMGGGTCGSR